MGRAGFDKRPCSVSRTFFMCSVGPAVLGTSWSPSSSCVCGRQRQRRLAKASAKGRQSVREANELPVSAHFPPTCLGVTSEAFADALAAFVREDPDRMFTSTNDALRVGPSALSWSDVMLLACIPQGVLSMHCGSATSQVKGMLLRAWEMHLGRVSGSW